MPTRLGSPTARRHSGRRSTRRPVAASPQTTSRTALGPVYIPAGKYKITSDISILSVLGFKFIGDGAWTTQLVATGSAFTTAVLSINGSADGLYGGFSITSSGSGTGGPHTFPNGVNVTWTGPYTTRTDTGCGTTSGSTTVTDAAAITADNGKPITNANIPANTTISAVSAGVGYTLSAAATATATSQSFVIATNPAGVSRSTTGNKFYDIRITGKFVTGWNMAGIGTWQLDGEILENIVISGGNYPTAGVWNTTTGSTGTWPSGGYWQNGYIFGNGSWGNIYDELLYNCSVGSCYYGYYVNVSSIGLYGAQGGGNAVDFFIIPGAQCTISNIQSQNSGQFLAQTSTFSAEPVSFTDCQFLTSHATTPNVVDIYGGQWDFHNLSVSQYANTGGAVAPVINIRGAGGGRPAMVVLTNPLLTNTFPAGIGASAGAIVAVTNYGYYATGALYTVTPFAYYNGSAWIMQSTATGMQAPTVTATGITGATAASRYAGATVSGAPTGANPFLVGDFVVDQTGVVWVCTVAGSPGTWTAGAVVAPNVQLFTAGGTWTKPTGAKTVFTALLGGGPGGGSGASGASGTVQSGGGGGGSGAVISRQFVASDLGSTVTVTVGGGGNGGAAVTGMTPRVDTDGGRNKHHHDCHRRERGQRGPWPVNLGNQHPR